MDPQDELLVLIQRLVAERVRPEHQAQFVQIVAITVAQLMADPRFLTELAVVQQLQQRIAHLANENVLLKQVLSDQGRRPPAKAAPRKAAPRKRTPSKANTRQFQQGVRDVGKML